MKACPVCGANAFDDAELCFGCLHRFDASSGRFEPREGRAAVRAATGGPEACAPQVPPSGFSEGLAAGSFPGRPPDAPPAARAAAGPALRVPLVQAPPQATAAASSPAAQTLAARQEGSAAVLERDPAVVAAAPLAGSPPEALVVRFELPGYAAVLQSGPAALEAGKGGCELLADAAAPFRAAPCDLVVRFQSKGLGQGEERRAASLRGSHVRDRALDGAEPSRLGGRP